jgi:hypothetical protein
MRRISVASVALIVAMALVAAACGGDDDAPIVGAPRLVGTPLATATPLPVTPIQCDVEDPLPVPANFPPDVPIPPGYEIATIQTDPHLQTVGRLKPPSDAEAGDAPVFLPATALEVAIIENMRAVWFFRLNTGVDGRDYNFEHQDGRRGHFNAVSVRGCPEHAELTYDFFWITPAAAVEG